MGLFGGKKSYIGLDIGEYSIKMVRVTKTKSGWELTNFAIVPTPKGAIDGEHIRDGQALIAAIHKAVAGIEGNELEVALSMAGPSVFIRHLTLPLMSGRELAVAVAHEAESHLPIPIPEAIVDFVKVGELMEDGVRKQEIMLVAARKRSVEQLQSLLIEAGLKPALLDVQPLALLRTAVNLFMNKEVNGAALVDIGTSTTTVSIFEGNVLRFTRTLPTGGQRLTQALVDHYQMPVDEAEATKRLLSLSTESNNSGLSVLLHQKAQIVSVVVENMITEIRRSIEFYQSRNRGKQVSQIFVSGGGAQLQGLADYLQDALNIKVELMNPISRLQINPQLKVRSAEVNEAGASLAVVTGLAMSEVK